MRRMLVLGVVAAWLLGAQPGVVPAMAQEPAPQKCSASLAGPTRDSVRLRVGLQIHANQEHDLPEASRQGLAEGIRERLVLPTPLGMDAYEATGDSAHVVRAAHLAMWGSYQVTLMHDGRIADATVTGGTRNDSFDAALLQAMRLVDPATVRLALAAAGVSNEDIPIRIEVSTRTMENGVTTPTIGGVSISVGGDRPARRESPMLGRDADEPVSLFVFRAPLRVVTQVGRQIPGGGPLRLPASLRTREIHGAALVSYVVDDDGAPDAGSIVVRHATHREFARSVAVGLQGFRFHPLVVEGCAVRQIVTQPFTFSTAP